MTAPVSAPLTKSTCIQSALGLLLQFRAERMALAEAEAQATFERLTATGTPEADAALAADLCIDEAVADIKAKRQELGA